MDEIRVALMYVIFLISLPISAICFSRNSVIFRYPSSSLKLNLTSCDQTLDTRTINKIISKYLLRYLKFLVSPLGITHNLLKYIAFQRAFILDFGQKTIFTCAVRPSPSVVANNSRNTKPRPPGSVLFDSLRNESTSALAIE